MKRGKKERVYTKSVPPLHQLPQSRPYLLRNLLLILVVLHIRIILLIQQRRISPLPLICEGIVGSLIDRDLGVDIRVERTLSRSEDAVDTVSVPSLSSSYDESRRCDIHAYDLEVSCLS